MAHIQMPFCHRMRKLMCMYSRSQKNVSKNVHCLNVEATSQRKTGRTKTGERLSPFSRSLFVRSTVPCGSATPTLFRCGRSPPCSSETHFYKAIAITEACGIEFWQNEPSIWVQAFCRGAVFREGFARLTSLKRKLEQSTDEW